MSEMRDALYQIANCCIKSRTYTQRISGIHEVAMRALGMTASQRAERHKAAKKYAEEHQQKRIQRQRDQYAPNNDVEPTGEL